MPAISLNHLATLHRIDRDRRSLHAINRNRLGRSSAAMLRDARRSADPAASIASAANDALVRPAMLAYLRGLRRAVLETSRAIGRDVRVAHIALSRADDEKRERELLLWLIAWLGLSGATVEAIRQQATGAALNASAEIAAVTAKRIRGAFDEGGAASELIGKSELSSDLRERQHEPSRIPGNDRGPTLLPESVYQPNARGAKGDGESGNGRHAGSRQTNNAGVSGGGYNSIFGTFGRANVSDSLARRALNVAIDHARIDDLNDTWAEAVAYTQYESGRFDAGKYFPAISEALWGYRWSSVLDTHTTVGCRVLDGWVAPLDDRAMSELRPPRHWGCRSVLVPVYQSSRLRTPVEVNRPSDGTIARYFEQKQEYLRRIAA